MTVDVADLFRGDTGLAQRQTDTPGEAFSPRSGLDQVIAVHGVRAAQHLCVDVGTARQRGVDDQVVPRIADVGSLPFEDASFDMVVSFTGLHCFPEPSRAVMEMMRVLKPGGVITGSTLLNDSGLRHEPMRRIGRLAGLLGPGCTGIEVVQWLHGQGVAAPMLARSGAMAYFRGVKG